MLTVVETHPVQYHAPVYRALAERHGIPVKVLYGSDFSVAGYHDREFRRSFAWDVDLVSGYKAVFLTRVAAGGARSVEDVSGRGLRRALRDSGRGPVLLLGYGARFDRAAALHAWRTCRPMLFRAETSDDARNRSRLTAACRDRVLRQLYRACAKLLYIGRRAEQHYRRLGGGDDKLVFSPYCVDTAPFQLDEASRARLRREFRSVVGAGGDTLVLLFSGKLSARKGVDLLMQSVKTLVPDVRRRILLVLLGDGELRPALAADAAVDPRIDVHFCGFKNQRQLSGYYHAADLLILPSRHSETWGLVVNEALHHGLPCIVSEGVGCAPDLIQPGVTGEVVERDSVESLAGGILRGQPLVGRAEIRNACRARAGAYSVEKAADGIASAYRAVVQ